MGLARARGPDRRTPGRGRGRHRLQRRFGVPEIAFYGLAGGAILFVIGEIWNGVRRYGHRELGLLMLVAGFSAGVATDFVIAYAGG